MHTRPDRTAEGVRFATDAREAALLPPAIIGAICLVLAYSVPPIVAYVLTISAFVLAFEGGLALYERAGAPAA